MTPTLQTLFFLGKGGTGKSTSAVLTALDLAARGKSVVLASFDDAHNLSDIFKQNLNHKPVRVRPGLEVLQVDRGREIKAYLSKTSQKVKQSYAYLTAFNLGNYFDVLKYSPGMEAHALVSAFSELKDRCAGKDVLIVDMPPTALSMHFFNLPALSLLWVQQLEKLREEINKRKKIVSRIKFAGKQIQRDKVLARIREIKTGHTVLQAFFRKQALCVAVHNGDALSSAETIRIVDELGGLGMALTGVVYSRRSPDQPEETRWNDARLDRLPSWVLPYSPVPLVGIQTLDRYAQTHGIALSGLIPQDPS
jgi:arsenite-transporting ATPase